MTDRREDILARLVTVIDGIADFDIVQRNKTDVSDNGATYAAIFDADEVEFDSDHNRPGRGGAAPKRVELNPEIYLTIGREPENVGAAINALRVQVVKAILADSTIAAICQDGAVHYRGCQTDLGRGRTMTATMLLHFGFVYMLKPGEL